MTQTILATTAGALDVESILARMAAVPEWLVAAVQGERVADELRRHVPEFASGAQRLHGCAVKRLLLEGASGQWAGTYNLSVEDARSGQRRTVALLGTIAAPTLATAQPAEDGAAQRFGADGWRCYLPELRLALEAQPPEAALDALPGLTEPEAARAMLEHSISAGSPAYRDLRIQACAPEVLSYKPGSRCTIRYRLEYPPALDAAHAWPATVIAKTYRNSKGQNAFDGMLALWHSPLATGDVVTIAEPLAYLPEQRVLLQGPVPEEQTLEDLLRAALSDPTDEAQARLEHFTRKAAAGLAALHQSGAGEGRLVAWEEKFAAVRKVMRQLAVPAPELAAALEPLAARLEALNAAEPAGPAVPTHGTFNPEQVLIYQGGVGFIDFDNYCLAEPALDVGFFRAAIKDTGMKVASEGATPDARERQLAWLDRLGEIFLLEYERLAPLARGRVALFEAQQYLRDALHAWAKFKPQPADRDNALLVLAHHLRKMGLTSAGD